MPLCSYTNNFWTVQGAKEARKQPNAYKAWALFYVIVLCGNQIVRLHRYLSCLDWSHFYAHPELIAVIRLPRKQVSIVTWWMVQGNVSFQDTHSSSKSTQPNLMESKSLPRALQPLLQLSTLQSQMNTDKCSYLSCIHPPLSNSVFTLLSTMKVKSITWSSPSRASTSLVSLLSKEAWSLETLCRLCYAAIIVGHIQSWARTSLSIPSSWDYVLHHCFSLSML